MPIPVVLVRPEETSVPPPGPPEAVDWHHTYVTITGSNGQGAETAPTRFAGPDRPSILIQAGALGLDAPPFELHSDDGPNLDGGIYRGTALWRVRSYYPSTSTAPTGAR